MDAPLLLARDHEGQLQPGRPTVRARLIYGIIFEEIIILFYVKLVVCAGMGYLARHKRYHVRSIA